MWLGKEQDLAASLVQSELCSGMRPTAGTEIWHDGGTDSAGQRTCHAVACRVPPKIGLVFVTHVHLTAGLRAAPT